MYGGAFSILGFLGALEGPQRDAGTCHACTKLHVYVTSFIQAKNVLHYLTSYEWASDQRELFLVILCPNSDNADLFAFAECTYVLDLHFLTMNVLNFIHGKL